MTVEGLDLEGLGIRVDAVARIVPARWECRPRKEGDNDKEVGNSGY